MSISFECCALLGRDLCDGTISGQEERVCVCVSFHYRKRPEKEGKYMLHLNKDIMKQYPNILKYRRSSTGTMNLDICVLNILNNINFSIQH